MILGRDQRARRLSEMIDRDEVSAYTLVRANPLTCPVHLVDRASINLSCTTCNGTGYINGVRADLQNISILGAPYNTLYYIRGDLQMGHGLRGSGGQSSFIEADRGPELLGDGIFYVAGSQRDQVTGALVMPQVNSQPRPDRIIRAFDQQVFTILHDLQENYGNSTLYHAFAVGIGFQTGGTPGMQG